MLPMLQVLWLWVPDASPNFELYISLYAPMHQVLTLSCTCLYMPPYYTLTFGCTCFYMPPHASLWLWFVHIMIIHVICPPYASLWLWVVCVFILPLHSSHWFDCTCLHDPHAPLWLWIAHVFICHRVLLIQYLAKWLEICTCLYMCNTLLFSESTQRVVGVGVGLAR